MRRCGELLPHDITGAGATGTAMKHMAATTTSNVHFQGVANAMRAPAASNSGYQPAAHITWKTPKINAQSGAASPTQIPMRFRESITAAGPCAFRPAYLCHRQESALIVT